MVKQFMVMDAWMREAEEASGLLEEVESKFKKKNPQELCRLRDTTRSKLLDLGTKLDRLECLLHNPPSRPFLTDEDLGWRWKMLSDIQLRTREVAIGFLVSASSSRPGELHSADSKETSQSTSIFNQDEMAASFSKDDPEMLKPLLSDNASQIHHKQDSFTATSWLWKTCWITCSILGATALLFTLFVVCAII
ncbi:uncharacterized protein LOC115743938 [Rhodamnia argentea]|uniref:Uncharacterized protein LOC115743938 n=1 Tax=Rhodamnia argentea TaxID=178133 RepID=A0A8B8PJC8_9MYRT|nr:uncharacterized protein LOC115743938 [Rhodamnia argentea]